MAASIRCLSKDFISKTLLRVVACRQAPPPIQHLATPTCQSVRYKGNKRFKAPPTSKDKEKWLSRAKRVDTKDTMPPKDYAEFLSRVPLDDVWIHKHYPPPRCSFVRAIQQHHELAAPDMHDSREAIVYAQLQLDMTTNKKTKFLSPVSGTILLPNNFDDGTQNRVAVICKTSEDQQKALDAGAIYVGGLELIRQIERGDLKLDEFDSLCCHVDSLIDVAVIRKHLKDQFPSKKKGSLGTDMASMVRLFVNGRGFESIKETDAVARLTIAIGKLSMSLESLQQNYDYVVTLVSGLKSSNLGRLIRHVTIIAPPSNEAFLLNDTSTGQTEREEPAKEADQSDDEGEEHDDDKAAAVKK